MKENKENNIVHVKIDYIDGTVETVEAVERVDGAYYYHKDFQMFFIYLLGVYQMMLPREFVKSIRVIENE